MTRDELGETVNYLIPNNRRENRIFRGKAHRRGLAGHHGHEGGADRANAAESHGQRGDEARDARNRPWW